jgi:hypothetical protein
MMPASFGPKGARMKRWLSFTILLTLALAPLAAQSTAGWKVRADRSTSATDPDGAGKIQFMAMGKGFHAINPQAAVYWNPANTAKGTYTLRGTFTLNEPSGHNNYYGLVFGGSNLEGAQQNYHYFLIAQDGTFLVKRRVGDAKTDNVVAKTSHAAIKAGGQRQIHERAGSPRARRQVDYAVSSFVVDRRRKRG